QPDSLGERQLRQDLVLVRLVEVFQNIDRIVGIEFLDGLGDLRVGQAVDDLEADRLVDLGQRGEVEIGTEQFHQRTALLRLQSLQKVAELGLVEIVHILLERKRIAVGDRRADLRKEGGEHDAILAIDIVMDAASGSRVSRLLVLTFHRASRCQRTGKGCASRLTRNVREYQTKCIPTLPESLATDHDKIENAPKRRLFQQPGMALV